MAELFDNYEINRAPRWPRLARALAGSFVLHGLLFLAVAFVPTIRAVLHLVGMASGADYVSEDYTLGEIRERATIVKLTDPHQKLYYPPGYFETNAPNAPVAEEVPQAARPLPTPKPVKPTPTPVAMPTPAPTASPEVAANNQNDGEGKPLTEEERKAQDEKERRAALDKVAEQSKVKLPPKINSKPFKDLLTKWNDKYVNGELNLKNTISVTLEADREDDGTLTNMELTGGSAGDPSLKDLAQDIVKTLSASHVLAFLEGTRHLKMTLTLDQKKLFVVANTTVESEEKARDMASVYGLGIGYQRLKTGGKDEGEVWKKTSVEARGKQVIIKFEMPRDTASTLLAKQVPALKKDANK